MCSTATSASASPRCIPAGASDGFATPVLTDLRHLLRLFAIGRCLARHDALGILQRELPLPAAARTGLGLFQALFGRRRRNLREGERLAAAFGELGPRFIKLGQVLSVRPALVGGRSDRGRGGEE